MVDLLQAIQNLMRHCKGCFSVLEDAGITELMAGLVRQIVKNLTSDGWENDIPVLVESCTEAILAIADSEPAARSKVITALMIYLFELLEHPALVFKSRIEVLKSVNMLLEQCPVQIKEQFLNEEANCKGIAAFVEMIASIGDYEFQVCIIECLMRLFPRKARQKYAETFFQDQKLFEEFLMIRDKVFETDCRIFLNNANARNEDPTKGVYSFPCSAAYIGDKQLRKPNDENYEEFWVDFNIGSMRITLFCEQDGINSQGSQMDEDMWETLEICKSNIKKYAVSVEEGIVALDISLKTSIGQLYSSQHSTEQGDCVTIEFHLDLEEYIAHAVNYTFNFERQKKSKVSTVEFPIQISVKDQDVHEEVKKTREQHVNYTCHSHGDDGSQSSQSKRRKVSVPQVPLKLNSTPYSTSTFPVNKQTNKHGGTPKAKTIPIKSSKGIKTPVVEVCDPVKKDKREKSNPPKDAQKKKTKDKEEIKCNSQNLESNQTTNGQKDLNNREDEVKAPNRSLASNQIKKGQKEKNKGKDEVKAAGANLDSSQDKQKEKTTRKDDTDSTCPNPEVKNSIDERPKQKKTRKNKDTGNCSQEDIIIPESQLFQDGLSAETDSGKHSKDSSTTEGKSSATDDKIQHNDDLSVSEPNPQDDQSCIAKEKTKVSVPQDIPEKKINADSYISNKIANAPEKSSLPEKEKKKDVNHQVKCVDKDLEENNLSKNHFGFDDLGEIDRVPESLEFRNSNPDEAVMDENKGNDNEKISINKKDMHDEIRVNADESNSDHSKERKLSKKQAGLNKKSTIKEKVKPSFKDVDSSLKELCDLDEQEALKEKKQTNIDKKVEKKCKANNPMLEERRPLSQEEVDSIYTFQDPDDERNEKVSLTREKKISKQAKVVMPESPTKKSKGRSTKSKQGNKEKKCSEINDQKSDQENNANIGKGAKVSDKTTSSNPSKSLKESESRSLRSRRQKPNYKDIDTDVESTVLERSEDDSVESLKDKEPIHVIDNAGKTKGKDNECKLSKIKQQNQSDNTAKINNENIEGKIVTVNSDESDIDMGEDTNMPELQENGSDEGDSLVSEPDKDHESVGDSLYVETDDSCNARSYKINCKERKKRRSSLKKSVKLNNAATKDSDKREKKVLNKSVSFDDSVLNDISPIKKQAHDKHPAKKGGKSKYQDTRSKRGRDNKQKDESSVVNAKVISLKTHSKQRIKSSPVQVSYSKTDAKNRPWSSLVQTSSKGKPGTGYDPFDFEEQIENSSNRSERIGRLDISSELNKKHGCKPAKQSGKSNNSKPKSKISSFDKTKTSCNEIRSSKIKKESGFDIQDNEDRSCSMFGNQSDDHDSMQSPALMVQDYTTKKWHRSKTNKKGAKQEKVEQVKTKQDRKEKKDVLNSSISVNSDTDSSVQKNEISEDGSLYIESNNTLQNILKAFESNRHQDKDTRLKTVDYFGEYPDPSGLENDVCISPIQTPHISSFSTPKVTNGRRKHYTPLNISVITPQSATPGISEKEMLNLQSDEENVSSDNYRETKSTSSNEKSWIKSKLKPQQKKKTPVTYKHRRKEQSKYYKEDSESQSEDSSSGGVREKLTKDQEKMNKQKLDSLKSCFVQLEDMMLASEPNEEEEADAISGITSVSGFPESCISSLVNDVTSRLKSQNLDELILSPYTPIKSEKTRRSEENNISLIQTQENYSFRLDNQDREESFRFYNSKLHKHTLMGDSGFQSGPSSAVRPTSNNLKRRYPIKLLSDHDDDEDESDQSEEEKDNFSFIPKKLFKFDPSVKEKTPKYEDLHSSPVLTEERSTNFGYDTGFSSFLNSFGSDIKRQMERKREQVDAFTKQAVKELNKHHSQNWVVQQQYRSNVDVEFKTKMLVELEELERDIDLLKQAGQKTTELYKYQLDVLQRNKTRQTSSLSNMKNIQSYLMDKSLKVEKHNKDLQINLKDLWKKDMMSLQRKLIDQQQKEELVNAKRNLQRTFSTSMIW